MSTDCDPGIMMPDQNPAKRNGVVIPEALAAAAGKSMNEAITKAASDQTIRSNDEALKMCIAEITIAIMSATARWMREECAKVAETYAEDIPDADQDVFHDLGKKIRLIGTNQLGQEEK